MNSPPIAILISDVHYSLSTLELADTSFRMAIDLAAKLEVELIDCGDLTNDKALLRGEVVNRMIQTFEYAQKKKVRITCLVGNHSLINEKSKEHSLEFLRPYAYVVDSHGASDCGHFYFIPYQTEQKEFIKAAQHNMAGRILITHQGFTGSAAGHYFQDHSAVDPTSVKGRSIGGHYHNHQNIGSHTFVGNPYTLTFGEANDHPKGICVLYEDGTVKHVPTKLRKHIIVERDLDTMCDPIPNYVPGDLLWVKLSGNRLELDQVSREALANELGIPESFKFDKIPLDSVAVQSAPKKDLNGHELMDQIIDSSPGLSEADSQALKALHREIM